MFIGKCIFGNRDKLSFWKKKFMIFWKFTSYKYTIRIHTQSFLSLLFLSRMRWATVDIQKGQWTIYFARGEMLILTSMQLYVQKLMQLLWGRNSLNILKELDKKSLGVGCFINEEIALWLIYHGSFQSVERRSNVT